MATTLLPGTHTGWNIQKWQKSVEGATYQKMKFVPLIDEGDRPFYTLNIRKHARVGANTLSNTGTATGLTYGVVIGTAVTCTPTGHYVGVEWQENLDAETDLNLDSEATGNIEQALAESTDQTGLELVSSLTQIMSEASVSGNMLRQAYGRLMGNTNGMASPGEEPQVYGAFSHTQYPNLSTIPEFNAAEVRGDSETPYVKGIWTKGGGIMLVMTTVVQNDANGYHNCLFIPSAFVVAWNVRSRIKRQDDELVNRVIVYNNVGFAVKHDYRALDLRTTASAL